LYADRRFQFHKRSQLFIRVRNVTFPVTAMCVGNPDCSPAGSIAETDPPTIRLSEIVSDNFRIRHAPPHRINELQLTGQATTVMRMRFLIIFALTAAFTFGVWVTPACGQDPAVVNSKTIRVRFENDRVRVLEAILPPGSKEQVHSHPAYVIYVLAGGRYRNYAADGKITEGTFQTGDVIYRDPLTHAAENIGDKPMHFILVELKSEAASGTSARP
jgi:quercetin dioxygenase-like cupin family protein